MNEEWRDIKGFEGLYQVSNLGRVKSVEHMIYNPAVLGDGCYRTNPEKILKPYPIRQYLGVHLVVNKRHYTRRIHILVAEAFISEQPTPNHRVIHLDGDITNNCVDNLQWVTYKEYVEHNRKCGIMKPLTNEQRQRLGQSISQSRKDNPELCRKSAERMREVWADDEYKARVSQKISDGWKRRMAAIEAAKPPKEIYHVPDLPGEEWRDVTGFEGQYAVSNMGRVKSLHRDLPHAEHGTWHISERLLRQGLTGRGNGGQYYGVSFHLGGGKMKMFKVHRLVADAFIPKVEGKNVVNHKDCNKLNNHVDNLEWCTDLENVRHAIAHNRFDYTSRRKKVMNVETGEVFESVKAAEEHYHVGNGAIGHAATKGYRCCGYHWQYISQNGG